MKVRVWNHGRFPIILPGGLVNPEGSIEIEEDALAAIKTEKIKTVPPPPREPRARKQQVEVTDKKPRRRRRKED